MIGKVYLVGAGCGDPELITWKGLNLLRKCDVVLYDDLVAPKLLEDPLQGSSPGLLHCRWILYQLSYKGSHTHGDRQNPVGQRYC